MKAEVTEQEYQIVRGLGDIWNLFLELPNEHPMQNQEFCQAIHRCQDMVFARAGIRAVKEFEVETGMLLPPGSEPIPEYHNPRELYTKEHWENLTYQPEGTAYPSDGKVMWREPLFGNKRAYTHIVFFSK